jgi:hypothetical protein
MIRRKLIGCKKTGTGGTAYHGRRSAVQWARLPIGCLFGRVRLAAASVPIRREGQITRGGEEQVAQILAAPSWGCMGSHVGSSTDRGIALNLSHPVCLPASSGFPSHRNAAQDFGGDKIISGWEERIERAVPLLRVEEGIRTIFSSDLARARANFPLCVCLFWESAWMEGSGVSIPVLVSGACILYVL